MSKKPTGRRRADVDINVLESMQLRSRRSIREAERRRSKRANKRAEKIEKRAAAKLALANAISTNRSKVFVTPVAMTKSSAFVC